jgi:hypothetical protein
VPSFVNASAPQTNAGANITVNMPASLVVGDYVFVWLRHSAASGVTTHAAGVFTAVAGMNSLNGTALWYRKIDGSEAASYQFTAAAVQTITDAVAVQFSGVIGSGDPVDVKAGGTSVALTTSASLSVITTVADTLLVFSDAKNASSRTLSASPTGMTSRIGPTTTYHIFDLAQASVGASGSKQATMTATSNHFNSLIAIKSPPTLTITPSAIDSIALVGTPELSVVVESSGIDSTAAVGTPLLQLELLPTGIDSSAAIGTPTLSLPVDPTGIDSTAVVGTPSLTLSVDPSGIDSTAVVGTPELSVVVEPEGIDSTAAVGTPELSTVVELLPTGIDSTAAVGTPELSVVLEPSGIDSSAAIGVPTVVSEQFLSPAGIGVLALVGTPNVAIDQLLLPSGIGTLALVGAPNIASDQFLSAAGIDSLVLVGTPTVKFPPSPESRTVTLRENSRSVIALDNSRATTIRGNTRRITVEET